MINKMLTLITLSLGALMIMVSATQSLGLIEGNSFENFVLGALIILLVNNLDKKNGN